MRIAIIGGKVEQRYFDRSKYDQVWMLNGQWLSRPWAMPTHGFNLHPIKLLKKYRYQFDNEIGWANANPDRFITMDRWPGVKKPNVLDFKKLGSYHCGSFDWMVAYATTLKPKSISLHGIGLCLEAGEPISARACLEYWCGFARGKGIDIIPAADTDIFHFYHLVKSHLIYGVDDTPIYEDRTKRGAAYEYE